MDFSLCPTLPPLWNNSILLVFINTSLTQSKFEKNHKDAHISFLNVIFTPNFSQLGPQIKWRIQKNPFWKNPATPTEMAKNSFEHIKPLFNSTPVFTSSKGTNSHKTDPYQKTELHPILSFSPYFPLNPVYAQYRGYR